MTATAATNITTVSATFTGTVNSNGVTTDVAFLTASSPTDQFFYHQLAAQSPFNGNGIVSAGAIQLQPNTTYYYQVRGTNTGGESFSNIVGFQHAAQRRPRDARRIEYRRHDRNAERQHHAECIECDSDISIRDNDIVRLHCDRAAIAPCRGTMGLRR